MLTDEATMERKSKPIMGFEERILLVSYLKMVDMAVPQREYTPHINVGRFVPDILFESTSHDATLLAHSKSCIKSYNGRLIVMPYYPDQSSTMIKERIKHGNKKEERS